MTKFITNFHIYNYRINFKTSLIQILIVKLSNHFFHYNMVNWIKICEYIISDITNFLIINQKLSVAKIISVFLFKKILKQLRTYYTILKKNKIGCISNNHLRLRIKVFFSKKLIY